MGPPAIAITRRRGRRAVRVDFFGRKLAVAVLVELLERLGRAFQLRCGNRSVLVGIERCNDRRDLFGFARRPLRIVRLIAVSFRGLRTHFLAGDLAVTIAIEFSERFGGGVDVNMHGESLQKGLPDRTYHEGEFEQAGHGAFEAPMAGNHGWFWQNLNDQPVTITVKTAGFYRRLFRP